MKYFKASLAWVLLGLIFLASPLALAGDKKAEAQRLILERLKSELQLTSAQSTQLDKLLNENRQERQEIKTETNRISQELKTLRDSGNKVAVQEKLKELRIQEDKLRANQDGLFNKVKKVLTPDQVAGFVITMDEIQEQVKEAREIRRVKSNQKLGGQSGGEHGLGFR